MNNSAIIIDTPAGIAAYRLLAIKSALKLETKGLQMSRGVKASVIARDELKKAGKAAPANKAKLLATFETHLREIGVLVDTLIAAPGNRYLSVYDPMGHEWIATHKDAFVMTLAQGKTRLEIVKQSEPQAFLCHMA
jgi:anion-transporting  ArsA/GET3 family ATPase